MKTKTLNIVEVNALCEKEESHFFEKKSKLIKPSRILRHIVAFANAEGGDIIIGINDDSEEPSPGLRWDGCRDIEDFNDYFSAISIIQPSISYLATFLKSAAHQTYALHITIDKTDKVHHTPDNKVYIRNSAQSQLIRDPQRIKELSFAKGESSFEDSILKDADPEDIYESKEIVRFLSDYSPSSGSIDFMVNQNLVHRKTYEPRAAGILLFSDNPSSIIPRKCAVKISRYITTKKVPERDYLREQFSVEGPLYYQIHETIKRIQEIMGNISAWTSRGLEKVNYPPETIWEIVVNAIIHRDYSISDDVQVLIFDDRIEVVSPGKLPGYVTVENILESRFSRNSKIVRILNRYENPPNKDMGEGLNTAFQKMAEFRLKDPIIAVEDNYVRVIIPHSPLASPEDAILEFLKGNDQITNRIARQLTGIKSENAVKNVFYKLRDQNLVERVPGLSGKSSAWRMKQ